MTIRKGINTAEGFSTHHMPCPHDCPDTCSLLVTKDDTTGKAISVRGDPTHPVTKGFLCTKVNHYLEYVYNDKRVMYPHKRIGPKGPGARFERISWDEALDTITDNFKNTIEQYGTDAVQPYSYSGTLGMLGYWSMDQRFWNKMNAARLDQSICIYAAMWAGLFTYGLANGPSIDEAAKKADLIILWGANLVSTGVHAIPAINAAKARGAKIIVIDPRVTRTTMLADWHIQPKPGTDGALALGMMKIIVDDGNHDLEFLKEQTLGWDEFLNEKIPQYDVGRVSRITGLPEATIIDLARQYGATKNSYIRANYGLNRHQNAGQMARAILTLPCITGAWREPCGGVAFGQLEEMWLHMPLAKMQRPELGNRAESRIINMVQIGRALNQNIGVDGKKMNPPIKSLFIYNSDPANCAPNTNAVRNGMARDDLFIACHDTFWTDSCMYADIVLPADTQMEREDLHAAYGNWYFSYNKPIIKPLGESVRNTELFRMLAQKMGYDEDTGNAFTQTDQEMIEEILSENAHPLLENITFDQLKENGWARGNVESEKRNFLENGWPTPSGKIEIRSDALAQEYPGIDAFPTYVPEQEGQEDPIRSKYPLQVLSSAAHTFIGSSFQKVPRLHAMMSRPTVEMSPIDAAQRNLSEGDFVRIYNDRGETYCHVVIIPALLPGVIATQKQINGSNTAGGTNVNALNSEMLTDFGRSPSFYSVLAEVEKVDSKSALAIA